MLYLVVGASAIGGMIISQRKRPLRSHIHLYSHMVLALMYTYSVMYTRNRSGRYVYIRASRLYVGSVCCLVVFRGLSKHGRWQTLICCWEYHYLHRKGTFSNYCVRVAQVLRTTRSTRYPVCNTTVLVPVHCSLVKKMLPSLPYILQVITKVLLVGGSSAFGTPSSRFLIGSYFVLSLISFVACLLAWSKTSSHQSIITSSSSTYIL